MRVCVEGGGGGGGGGWWRGPNNLIFFLNEAITFVKLLVKPLKAELIMFVNSG